MRSLTFAAAVAAVAIPHSTGSRMAARAVERSPRRDAAYPGTIVLDVDLRDIDHKVMHVRERLPLPAGDGPLTLLYPQWESASHAPTLEANSLAGLHLAVGDVPVAWRRDPLNPYAFRVDLPRGARQLDVAFDYLSPVGSGPKEMTPALLTLSWSHVVLYPAGWHVRDLPVQATIRLPPGFAAVTSMEAVPAPADYRVYAPVSLETLVDSPVYAGRHVRTASLGKLGNSPVDLHLLAADPAALAITPSNLDHLRALAQETGAVFGQPHFRQYAVLASLSDELPATGGTEHQRSGENNFAPDFFTDPGRNLIYQDLIAHELVHSWNGKSRQPQGLWTADFNTPSDNSLLWIYEGQTEYWGIVLAARAGLRTPQETLDYLAVRAADARARVGRSWKSLSDSSLDPVFDAHHAVSWRDWQGREAYYPEGVLLWLDIDTLIRERTGGRHSLDSFAYRFFGGADRGEAIRTYTFDDLVAALTAEAPLDWRRFLQTRLDAHDDAHLYDGIARGGFALASAQIPTETAREAEADEGGSDLRAGLGLLIGRDGQVRRVAWDSPSFRAGLAPGAVLTSVNAARYEEVALRAALGHGDLHLRFVQDGVDRTAIVRGTSAQGWPVLRPTGARPWLLDILKPRRP